MVSYSYDPANRLSQVTDWNGNKTTYSYDAGGNRISVTLGNGSTTLYFYDNAERLTRIVNGTKNRVLSSFVYALDAVGNRTQIVDASDGQTLYGYDALNRLISWTPPSGQATSYRYDAVGNRTSQAGVNGNTIYAYDDADRLLTAGARSFTYDGNGNRLTTMTGGTMTTYGWDSLNRLMSVAGGGANSHYAYDGDGNRILQEVTTGSYQYLNDVATRLPVVLNENGPDGNIDYAFGLSLLSEDVGGKGFYYQRDGLGSVVTVTNEAGAHQANYNYDPWGQDIRPTVPPIGLDALGTENKLKFTGEALDPQTNLYFLRARYYDPTVARFISKDPLPGAARNPLSRNRFAYARNNPLQYTDRSGRAAQGLSSGDLSGLGGFLSTPFPGGSSLYAFEIPLPGGISIGLRDSSDPPPNPDDCLAAQLQSPFSGACGATTPTTNLPQLPIDNIPSYPNPDSPLQPPLGWPFGDILTTPQPYDPFQNYLSNLPDPSTTDYGPFSAGSTSAPIDYGPFDAGSTLAPIDPFSF